MNEQEQRIYTELLIIRCQQGDKEAFDLIVELWHKPLLGFALRYLDPEIDAGDVVQETWVSVIEGLNKLQSPNLFVSWMFRILTNKCIDRIREKKAQQHRMEHANIHVASLETSNDDESLRRAIQELPGEHKMLIMLRFEQGLQIGQIAAMLNIAEGTVKSRLHRAMARLREILGDKT